MSGVRRRYAAWLAARLDKKTLTREEVEQILTGQLMLPVSRRDVGLMKECAAALDEMDGISHVNKENTWRRIFVDILEPRGARARLPGRRAVVVMALLMALLLAVAALAAFAPRSFSFLMGAGSPDSYVQQDAAGLLKTNLGRIRGEHVEIAVTEAVYDGKELRVVYSIRELGSSRMYTDEEAMNDYASLVEAAELDGFNTICDWVEINGEDVQLSDCGQRGGDQPGEILFYLQSLLSDWNVYPKGDFTVGLPLHRKQVPDSQWPRAVVPEELTFILNAEEALKTIRTASPAEITDEGVRIELTEATFSPVAGAVYLRFTGTDEGKAYETAQRWWSRAQLYDPSGTQSGICSPEMLSDYIWGKGISAKLDVVPPEAWPEEMLLAVPDESGKTDMANAIPVKLHQKRQ